jgi:hypothetical protein
MRRMEASSPHAVLPRWDSANRPWNDGDLGWMKKSLAELPQNTTDSANIAILVSF